jgi:rhodanese-related sulfurtransferase
MQIERFFVPGLAHASYLVASAGEAVVVDPERNVAGYVAYLARNKLKLNGIFLTHPHADFVAGHAELSARTGAPILFSDKAPATFVHRDVKEGDRVTVGTVEIEVMATPGHSPVKEKGATTLDVCPGALFGEGHAVDSLNIGIASPSFSVWSGFFVNPDSPIALVVGYETEAQRAQLELARIGFDQVVGFFTADDLNETQQITQIGARDFLASLESPQRPVILDVRSAQEWSQDHLEGAINIPLPQLPVASEDYPERPP